MDLRQIKYVIGDHDDLDAEVRLNGERIGYANCVRDGDRLLLADIRVLEELPRHMRNVLQHLWSLINGSPSMRLRKRGIGSNLLKVVLHAADSTGIRMTWGSVMHDDLQKQPTLLAWYERHGFKIEEPDRECMAGAAKKIVRWQRHTSHWRSPSSGGL